MVSIDVKKQKEERPTQDSNLQSLERVDLGGPKSSALAIGPAGHNNFPVLASLCAYIACPTPVGTQLAGP